MIENTKKEGSCFLTILSANSEMQLEFHVISDRITASNSSSLFSRQKSDPMFYFQKLHPKLIISDSIIHLNDPWENTI